MNTNENTVVTALKVQERLGFQKLFGKPCVYASIHDGELVAGGASGFIWDERRLTFDEIVAQTVWCDLELASAMFMHQFEMDRDDPRDEWEQKLEYESDIKRMLEEAKKIRSELIHSSFPPPDPKVMRDFRAYMAGNRSCDTVVTPNERRQ